MTLLFNGGDLMTNGRGPELLPVAIRLALGLAIVLAYLFLWNPVRPWLAHHVTYPLVTGAIADYPLHHDRGTVYVLDHDGDQEAPLMRVRVHGRWLFFGVLLLLAVGHARPATYSAVAALALALEAMPYVLLWSGLPLGFSASVQLLIERYMMPAGVFILVLWAFTADRGFLRPGGEANSA